MLVRLQFRLQRALERLAVLAEFACDRRRPSRMPAAAARCNPSAAGLVGNNQRDLGRIGLILGGLDQRHHVGAAAGDQDGDALAGHAAIGV